MNTMIFFAINPSSIMLFKHLGTWTLLYGVFLIFLATILLFI